MNDIANHIKNLRKEKGLSQEKFAQALHVTRQTVSAWERGVAQPSLDTLGEIARVLEVEPEKLLYGSGQKLTPVYRAVSLWPVLGVIPLYFLMAVVIFPIVMIPLMGGNDVVIVLCGQIFLAVLMMFCYCSLQDLIRNREYYDQTEDKEDQ